MLIPVRRTDQPAHYLLDLEVEGAIYRFSDQQLEIVEGQRTVQYQAGLSALAIEVGEGPTAIAIELEPYAGAAQWQELVRRGALLDRASATVRRWYEGTAGELAQVIAQGFTVESELGGDAEALTFSIDSSRWDATTTIPALTQYLDATTWPVTTSPYALKPDPEGQGAYYPRIYGYPGRSAVNVWGSVFLQEAAVPAVLAEWGDGALTYNDSKLILAGHAIYATQATIVDVSGGYTRPGNNASLTLTVETMQDLRGQTVSFVRRGSGNGVFQMRPGNEYWAVVAGGVIDAQTGTPLRQVGAVISDLLSQAGVAVDRGRMAAARGQLDQYLVDAVIAEPVRAQDWIESVIGGSLSLVRREGPAGIWYELRRYEAPAAEIVAHLVGDAPDEASAPGTPVQRTSRLRWSDYRSVENEITCRYLPTRSGYQKTARLVADTSPDTAKGEYCAQLAAISQVRYGLKPAALEIVWTADDATALAVAQRRILERGICRRSFSVVGGLELDALEPNQAISYTEEAVGLHQAPAVIRSVGLGLQSVALTIELIDDPDQRGRT